jgi:hypothetical protein
MPKKEATPNRFLSRIYAHDKIEDLGLTLKEFLKYSLKIRHELDYKEIQESVHKKHILPEIKEKVCLLCDFFDTVEYRPKKPSKAEISKIKTMLREIIKKIYPEEKKPKKTSLFEKISKKIKKNTSNNINAEANIRREREKIKKGITLKVKERLSASLHNDEEYKEITRFIQASKNIGMKKSLIIKELKEIGFNNDKIMAAVNGLDPN